MAATIQAPSATATQTDLQVFGRGRISDLFGDMVLYRNLQPLDSRLSKLKVALRNLDLPSDARPRKQDTAYAQVALWYANQAQEKRNIAEPLQELLFIGDTIFNDGRAYTNMVAEGDMKGSCFIGVEHPDDEAHACDSPSLGRSAV